MTRFEAETTTDRRTLFAEAVTAHRARASPFCTMEATPEADDDGEARPAPWIQFAEQTVNLDCTDAELERLKELLTEFPEFRIDDLTSPETAEGTNVRITARSDANRVAAFVDRAFQAVYGRDEEYRAWVTAV